MHDSIPVCMAPAGRIYPARKKQKAAGLITDQARSAFFHGSSGQRQDGLGFMNELLNFRQDFERF